MSRSHRRRSPRRRRARASVSARAWSRSRCRSLKASSRIACNTHTMLSWRHVWSAALLCAVLALLAAPAALAQSAGNQQYVDPLALDHARARRPRAAARRRRPRARRRVVGAVLVGELSSSSAADAPTQTTSTRLRRAGRVLLAHAPVHRPRPVAGRRGRLRADRLRPRDPASGAAHVVPAPRRRPPARVAINARAAVRAEIGGVERLAREMALRLPALRPDRYRVIAPSPRFAHRAGHAWEQAMLPALAAGCALVYSPANLAPLACAAQRDRDPRRRRVPAPRGVLERRTSPTSVASCRRSPGAPGS